MVLAGIQLRQDAGKYAIHHCSDIRRFLTFQGFDVCFLKRREVLEDCVRQQALVKGDRQAFNDGSGQIRDHSQGLVEGLVTNGSDGHIIRCCPHKHVVGRSAQVIKAEAEFGHHVFGRGRSFGGNHVRRVNTVRQRRLEGRNQAQIQRRLWRGITQTRIGLELPHLCTGFSITATIGDDRNAGEIILGQQVIFAQGICLVGGLGAVVFSVTVQIGKHKGTDHRAVRHFACRVVFNNGVALVSHVAYSHVSKHCRRSSTWGSFCRFGEGGGITVCVPYLGERTAQGAARHLNVSQRKGSRWRIAKGNGGSSHNTCLDLRQDHRVTVLVFQHIVFQHIGNRLRASSGGQIELAVDCGGNKATSILDHSGDCDRAIIELVGTSSDVSAGQRNVDCSTR